MLDLHAPLELDDGRPVEVDWETYEEEVEEARAEGVDGPMGIPIIIQGPWERGDPMHDNEDVYWYDRLTGIWEGSTAERAYVVRNVLPDDPIEPEDWS